MPSLEKRTRSAGGLLASATKRVVFFPLRVAQFFGRQAVGTYRNARGFLGWLTMDRALPPVVVSTFRWLGEKVPLALGADSSYEQTAAAGVIMLGAITATILTFGLTAAVVLVMFPFLLIGLWRFVPAFNNVWTAGRRKIPSRDGNGPGWDR